jgi:hypothetical protein
VSVSFFLPCCAWALKREAGFSQSWGRAFRVTAKFFARFAKGAALELCGGTETVCGALPQQRTKERKAERAQVPGATDVG